MAFLKKAFLPILLGLVVFTGLVWIAVIPYNQAPDEYTHFDVANFIATHNRFPVFSKDENMGVSKYEIPGVVLKYNASYSAMPPLAYLWQAGFIKVLRLGENSYAAARIANLLLGILTAVIAWALSRQFFKEFYQQATFTLLSIFIPQIIFTFVYVNSDGILLLFSFLLWWWLVRFLKQRVSFKDALGFGLTLGLAVLTRYNIAPLIIVSLGVFVWRLLVGRKINYKKGLQMAFTAGGVGLLISSWWYIRNVLLYKDVLATVQFWETYHMIYEHKAQGFLTVLFKTDWLWRSFQSLWGTFGWNTILFPDYVYRIVLIIFLFGIGGAISLVRRSPGFSKKLIALSLVMIVLSLVLSLWQSVSYGFQAQGRYLFPAWPGLVFLILVGWQGLLKKNENLAKSVNFIFILLVLTLSTYALIGRIIPAYY